jgi:hypothetical protein
MAIFDAYGHATQLRHMPYSPRTLTIGDPTMQDATRRLFERDPEREYADLEALRAEIRGEVTATT